jgi:hypothetical protein
MGAHVAPHRHSRSQELGAKREPDLSRNVGIQLGGDNAANIVTFEDVGVNLGAGRYPFRHSAHSILSPGQQLPEAKDELFAVRVNRFVS